MKKFKNLVLIGLIGYIITLICWILILSGFNGINIRKGLVILHVIMLNYTFFLLIYHLRHNNKGKKNYYG